MELIDKVAIVTGAGSGIGRAIAMRLAREGASVVVNDIAARGGRETAREIISCGGRAAFVRADISVEDEVRRMVAFAREAFGGLDVLVNNAGCALGARFPQARVASWSRVLDVYLRGTLLCTHYAVRAMRRGGAIVNISSGGGLGYRPHDAPQYAAAKAGVARLTSALGGLSDSLGIRVNCICPGWVNTPMSRKTIAAMTAEERAAQVPPTIREPEEIADAAVQLIRDDTLSGRVMLYYEGEERRVVPVETEV